MIRSFEPDLGTNFFENRFTGGDDSFDLVQIRATNALVPAPELPEQLAAHNDLGADEAVRTRRFELKGASINGKGMTMNRIDEVVEADTTETKTAA